MLGWFEALGVRALNTFWQPGEAEGCGEPTCLRTCGRRWAMSRRNQIDVAAVSDRVHGPDASLLGVWRVD
eukprot:8680018-Pyramimonas_sp.AAC.1